MQLSPYVETMRTGLVAAAAPGGEEARRIAESLAAALEPTARLALLEAIGAVAAEVTAALGTTRVEVHLRGREPEVVVASDAPPPADADAGTARVTLRLPDTLKARAERAAAEQHVSVNTWLVRAVARALESPATTHRPGRRTLTGYAQG